MRDQNRRSPYKTVKIIGFVLAICVFAALIIGCVHINLKYPEAIVERCPVGSSIEASGFTISPKEFKLLTIPEIRNSIPSYMTEPDLDSTVREPLSDDRMRILLITIAVKNNSTEEQSYDFSDLVAQSQAWTNGMDVNVFGYVNEEGTSTNLTLTPGEEKELTLPYAMMDFQFHQNEWENIDTRQFELPLTLYPVNKILTMQ